MCGRILTYVDAAGTVVSTSNDDVTLVQLPGKTGTSMLVAWLLIAIGGALILSRTFYEHGLLKGLTELPLMALMTGAHVLILLLCCFATAFITRASFGELRPAVVKLTAIYVAANATALFLPSITGAIFSIALTVVLLRKFFDLVWYQILALLLVFFAVSIGAVLLLALLVPQCV